MALAEVLLALGSDTIPAWSPTPSYLTEHELVVFMHLNVPCLLLLCGALSEYCYHDPDEALLRVVGDLIKQQKVRWADLKFLGVL